MSHVKEKRNPEPDDLKLINQIFFAVLMARDEIKLGANPTEATEIAVRSIIEILPPDLLDAAIRDRGTYDNEGDWLACIPAEGSA